MLGQLQHVQADEHDAGWSATLPTDLRVMSACLRDVRTIAKSVQGKLLIDHLRFCVQ